MQPHLLKLANEDLMLPLAGAQQEIIDIFTRLEKSFKEQRFDELQQKVQRGPLSPDEKREYQTLLIESK